MGFPDERDRQIIRQADQVDRLATEICDWLAEFNADRRKVDLLPIPESDEFEILQLRRQASSYPVSLRLMCSAPVTLRTVADPAQGRPSSSEGK